MRIKYTFIFVFALFATAELVPSSLTENEMQMLWTARMDGLQSKVDQLIYQIEEEKLLTGKLQSLNKELENKLHQLAAENVKQNELLEAKIDLLVAKNVQQDDEIRQLKSQCAHIIQPKSSLEEEDREMTNNNGDIISEYSSIRLPPSSCRQLSTIGHYLDGIYLVANPDTNKIEAVYCDFGSSTLSETLYGSVDVKTKSVHFYVQRITSTSFANTVLSFEVEKLNVGDAMNLATGIFTVPVDGIYHFQFSALKSLNSPANVFVSLQVNDVTISTSYAASDISSYLTLSVINASIRLKIGDQVRLYISSGSLADGSNRYTQFTGWLVEEDLAFASAKLW